MKAQETITIDLAAYEDERNADHGDAERRIHNLEHALEIAEEDNATLQARVIELEAERDALKEEVERCEASIRFWKEGACELFKELEER